MNLTSIPFSPYQKSGDFVFLSGQIGLKDGKLVAGDIEAETAQAIENVRQKLEGLGLSLKNVIDATVFITDMKNYETMNEQYAKSFGDHKPTRTTVGVKALPLGAKVEIKVIAHK